MNKTSNQVQVKVVAPKFDTVGFIMAYEDGQLGQDEIVEGFQHLINSGTVWQLQGSYGRMAARLIEAGLCVASEAVEKKLKIVA